MSRFTKFKKAAFATGVMATAAVVTSPAYAFVDEAATEIAGAKSGANTIAPIIIGAVAIVVGVSIILGLMRKV